MCVRLNVIVEGQTEETFVNQILTPHLSRFSIGVSARVFTAKKNARDQVQRRLRKPRLYGADGATVERRHRGISEHEQAGYRQIRKSHSK